MKGKVSKLIRVAKNHSLVGITARDELITRQCECGNLKGINQDITDSAKALKSLREQQSRRTALARRLRRKARKP
jgi:hypothetical protein